MRLAIPCEGNQVCEHLGCAAQFLFVDANLAAGRIEKTETLAAPPQQSSRLPQWVAAQGADVVLAVGMGGKTAEHFSRQGVDVVVGMMRRDPYQVVEDYLGGMLSAGKPGALSATDRRSTPH